METKTQNDVNSESENELNKNTSEKTTDLNESQPENKKRVGNWKGSKKGVHNGHEYKPDCKCIVCKQKTAKLIEVVSPQIIEEYKRNFIKEIPKNIFEYELTDSMAERIKNKIPKLKANEKFSFLSFKEFMVKLIDLSLINYLESL